MKNYHIHNNQINIWKLLCFHFQSHFWCSQHSMRMLTGVNLPSRNIFSVVKLYIRTKLCTASHFRAKYQRYFCTKIFLILKSYIYFLYHLEFSNALKNVNSKYQLRELTLKARCLVLFDKEISSKTRTEFNIPPVTQY